MQKNSLKTLMSALGGAVMAVCSTVASAQVLGDPFVANNYRQGGQNLFGATAAGNGDTLLLWQDAARGNDYFIQRYDGNGVALQSDEWYVGPSASAPAMDRFGNFALASSAVDGNGRSLYVTVYRRDGSVKVPKFKVNDLPNIGINGGIVAFNPDGQLVVAWQERGTGTTYGLQARTFSSGGVATSPKIAVVAPPASGNVLAQGLAIDGAGNFGIVWAAGTSAAGYEAYFRRYTNAGNPQTAVVTANTTTAADQSNASIAMSPSGDTIVTWESVGQDGSSFGVYGQRFSSAGTKLGSEFLINETTQGSQTFSRVAMTADGRFVVSWASHHTGTPMVYLRPYAANGSPLSGEVLVRTPAAPQGDTVPFLALDPAGNALIGWRAALGGGDVDVLARRYAMAGAAPVQALSNGIAANGLSGVAGSWTHFKITVPSGRPSLTVTLSGPGSTGNANLYGRLGSQPGLTGSDVASTANGNNEGVVLNNVPAGTWYFGVYGGTAFSGVSLTATY